MLGGRWFGVDVFNEDIADNYLKTVWEPALVKINAITAASEACCQILSIDETVKNPTSQIVSEEDIIGHTCFQRCIILFAWIYL